ncbi:MAG: hypothetical protein EBX37_17380 [Alphaproteobacteria bacterium]|nr:hypothetical protein [Alphaproteobacteria bacterium]
MGALLFIVLRFYSPAMSTATSSPQASRTHSGMPGLPLRLGTRGSPLALVQTRAFLEQIMAVCPVLRGLDAFREYAIATTGGGKGLFAREIHEALLDGRIDFAVHSLKDLETELPAGVVLACTLRREDARDVLILPEGEADPENPFASLPQGALVGSASLACFSFGLTTLGLLLLCLRDLLPGRRAPEG